MLQLLPGAVLSPLPQMTPCPLDLPKTGDKVTPLPALMGSLALSDSVLAGAHLILLLGFPERALMHWL